MQAARRPEGPTQYNLLNLQQSAFEAINEMVRSASADTISLVGHLIPVILQQLAVALDPAQASTQNSPSDLQVPLRFFTDSASTSGQQLRPPDTLLQQSFVDSSLLSKGNLMAGRIADAGVTSCWRPAYGLTCRLSKASEGVLTHR